MVIALSALMATRPTFGALTFGSSARRSTSARVAGVLLAPTASLATARPASRGSVVPFSHEFTRTRRKLGYVMDNDSIRTARDAWLADATAAEATYGHISTWDVSGVTDMSYLFCAASGSTMYYSMGCNSGASSFNEDISAWDISGVTNMHRIFRSTSDFDQALGWCVDPAVLAPGGGETVESVHESSCESTMCGIIVPITDARGITHRSCDGAITGFAIDDASIRPAVALWLSDSAAAMSTYGHISTWNTSGVTDMSYLFETTDFNEDIGAWDTSGVTTMRAMFSGALSFNQDIGGWDTSGVTSMSSMFYQDSAFNQDISAWDTSGVTTMNRMFSYARAFNQDIGGWAVHSVRDMDEMFRGATSFDQDLGWCLDDEVRLGTKAFQGTKCESTNCGVSHKDAIGICEPWARPCLIGIKNQCYITSPTLIIIIVLVLLAGFSVCVCCRKKKDETYAAAARRVLCRRGTKVRAVAPTTSEEALPTSVVSVVDAPAAGIAPNELGTVVSVKH